MGEELRWDIDETLHSYFGNLTTIPEQTRKSKPVWKKRIDDEGRECIHLEDRQHLTSGSSWWSQRSSTFFDVQIADDAVGFLMECDGIPEEASELSNHDLVRSLSPDLSKKRKFDLGQSEDDPNPLFRRCKKIRHYADEINETVRRYDFQEVRDTELSNGPGVKDNDPHNTKDFLLPRSPHWLLTAEAEHHHRCHTLLEDKKRLKLRSSSDTFRQLSAQPPKESCPSVSVYAYRAMMLGKPLLPITNRFRLHDLASIINAIATCNKIIDVLAVVISVDNFTIKRSRMPLKRDIHLADPSTSRTVILSVFTDPVNFNPTVGTVALFRRVTAHASRDEHLFAYESQCLGRDWFLPDPVCVIGRRKVAALKEFWEEKKVDMRRDELREKLEKDEAAQKDLDDKLIAYIGNEKFSIFFSAVWSDEAGAHHGDYYEIKRAQRLGLVEQPTAWEIRKRDKHGHLRTEPTPHVGCGCVERHLSTYQRPERR